MVAIVAAASHSSHPSLSPSSPSSTPLTVLIAGAGISGLIAGLGLRSQGHTVHIFEQSRFANEVGAAIHVAPNSNRILRRLGIRLEEGHGALPYTGAAEFDEEGNLMTDRSMSNWETLTGAPYHLMHRGQLHTAIKQQALAQGVQLHTKARVVEARPDTAELVLDNSEVWKGDVVIGADGVNSRTRHAIPVNASIFPKSTGRCGFRFLIPMDRVLADADASKLILRKGMLFKAHLGQGRIIVGYPCQDNTTLNCMAVCPIETYQAVAAAAQASSSNSKNSYYNPSNPFAITNSANKSWNHVVSKDVMLSVFAGVPAVYRAYFEMTDPDGVRLWELLDMDRLPTLQAGRLALIGDAAHPFTPWRGQGAAIAIEDAASIASLMPPGTTAADVRERLSLYESLRSDRAHRMQQISRLAGGDMWNTRRALLETSWTEKQTAAQWEKDHMTHDEWTHSETALQEKLREQKL